MFLVVALLFPERF
ncbi:hypothetical protein MRQ36_15750 [Micromonospora sp. R77]|nr:hypothetical protein [Micromonospora sp. R77]